MPNLWVIFTTGLIAGGLSCAAVQGGLLATALAQDEEAHPVNSRAPGVTAFLVAKLISHAALGAVLGWLGSVFELTPRVQAVGLGFISIFMVGTALSFLNVHPIFRYFVIQPPRFLTRYIRGRAKSGGIFAPAFIGLFSIFIPCGTTQAMMALAAATGNPLWGMAVLSVFVVGTAPLFFLLGISIDVIQATLKGAFGVVAASLIFILAVVNMNAALQLYGSPVTLRSIATSVYCTFSFCSQTVNSGEATKTPVITFSRSGYTVDNQVIRRGETINLTLTNTSGGGCIQAFTIPQLGVRQVVPLGTTKTLTFVAPNETGELGFSCSMGMYGGSFTVVQ